MNILPFGDQALLVNFEQRIDSNLSARIVTLANRLRNADQKGITYVIPSYCSLVVGYDPQELTYLVLEANIMAFSQDLTNLPEEDLGRRLIIPVCYDEAFGIDLEEVERQTGLPSKEIIRLHCQEIYHVFLIGFLPGFPYLGKLVKELDCSRKATPRLRVPAKSVGIAGLQTGIYPDEVPGGWQIIGRTPAPIFAPQEPNPFLFSPGDRVQFKSISMSEFRALEAEVKISPIDWSIL